MGERLREVPEQSLRGRIILLREETDVIGEPEQALGVAAGVLVTAEESEVVGKPEGAAQLRRTTLYEAVPQPCVPAGDILVVTLWK